MPHLWQHVCFSWCLCLQEELCQISNCRSKKGEKKKVTEIVITEVWKVSLTFLKWIEIISESRHTEVDLLFLNLKAILLSSQSPCFCEALLDLGYIHIYLRWGGGGPVRLNFTFFFFFFQVMRGSTGVMHRKKTCNNKICNRKQELGICRVWTFYLLKQPPYPLLFQNVNLINHF